MAETEVKKLAGLVEAARQRLLLARSRETFLKAREQTEAADELLAEAQKVLRTSTA